MILRRCKMFPPKNKWIWISLVSVVFFAAGGIALWVFPCIYTSAVAAKTNLVETSFLFPIWRDLPLPIYNRIYFFNITNAKDYLNGETMEVDEVGPYTYIGTWVKEDLEWHSDGTVSYKERKTYQFSREKSVGSESDKIYTLNGPYLVASDVLSESNGVIQAAADKMFRFMGEKLIIKKSIRELTFSGFKDPIIRYSKYMGWDSPFQRGKFAWLEGHNATDDGTFNVVTGENDHTMLNMIKQWNGFEKLDFWKDDYCNMINGTNIEFGPPLNVEQTEYTFFQPIFCRSVTFRYGGIFKHKGIETRRFINKADIFSKENPDNYCFEIDEELKSGVQDVSTCQFGAPVVMSFPHFYLADPSFLENIDGLKPAEDQHGSHLDVEPVSGVSVDISVKFQMNIKVKPVKHLSAFKDVKPGLYPIFWLDMSVELPDNLIHIINYQLFRPSRIFHITILAVMGLSLICFVIPICKKEKGDISERVPLLKKSSSKDLSVKMPDEITCDENKSTISAGSPSTEFFSSFKNLERTESQASGTTFLSIQSSYESLGDEELNTEFSRKIEVKHDQLFKENSFKESRVLTVV